MTEVTQQRIIAKGRVESSEEEPARGSDKRSAVTGSGVLANALVPRLTVLDPIKDIANAFPSSPMLQDQFKHLANAFPSSPMLQDQFKHLANAFSPSPMLQDQFKHLANAFAPDRILLDRLKNIAKQSFVGFPGIDPPWTETFDQPIPSNLRGVRHDLDVLASIAFDEGIPLSWIPRGEIVATLVEADSAEARKRILIGRQLDILNDCDTALTTNRHEWAVQCRSAIGALRHGHFQAAQSHASNIIYSIVATHPNSRGHALRLARRDLDEVPFQDVAPYLTLRPLDRTLVPWKPRAGKPLPAHFSRHATTHAVGNTGLFTPLNALIAVMLAVSLTIEHGRGGWQQ